MSITHFAKLKFFMSATVAELYKYALVKIQNSTESLVGLSGACLEVTFLVMQAILSLAVHH